MTRAGSSMREGEDGRSDFEISNEDAIATSDGVRSTGSTRGLGAGGAAGDTRAGAVWRRNDVGYSGKSGVDGGRGVGDTVGRSGDLGCVWHVGDNALRLGKLGVGSGSDGWNRCKCRGSPGYHQHRT